MFSSVKYTIPSAPKLKKIAVCKSLYILVGAKFRVGGRREKRPFQNEQTDLPFLPCKIMANWQI